MVESGDGSDAPGGLKIAYKRSAVEVVGDRLLNRFHYQDWAKRIALMLMEIEHDPFLRLTIENILTAFAEQAREKKKSATHLKVFK